MSDAPGPAPERLEHLLRRGSELWRDFLAGRGGLFHGFIPADHRGAHEALLAERPRCHSFLELGSGIGLITVLAALQGYDAYGIEIDSELVAIARDLDAEFGAGSTFAQGSFVPSGYRDEVSLLDADFLTVTEGADAYEELGLELDSFDLVYVYPWPGEEEWAEELVRRCAGPHTRLMTYAVDEGFVVRDARGAGR